MIDAKVWKALMTAPVTGADAILVTSTPAWSHHRVHRRTNTTRPVLGATGSAVKVLQRGLGGVVVDGTFSAKTLAAVKASRPRSDLPVTGVVDAATWSALELRGAPAAAVLPHRGQARLDRSGRRGAAEGAADDGVSGTYGPTHRGRRSRLQQEAAKLTQTGVVGSLTWKAIEARMVR